MTAWWGRAPSRPAELPTREGERKRQARSPRVELTKEHGTTKNSLSRQRGKASAAHRRPGLDRCERRRALPAGPLEAGLRLPRALHPRRAHGLPYAVRRLRGAPPPARAAHRYPPPPPRLAPPMVTNRCRLGGVVRG